MSLRPTLTVLLCLVTTPAIVTAAPQARQQIRELSLDGNARIHAVEVVGWPGVTTAIKFNDSFETVNVLCGQCTEVNPGEAETSRVQDERRNWIIEKRPAERSIHVRPAILPGRQKATEAPVPYSAFTTNVYVGLNGGHTVNIELKMLHPDILSPGAALAADAVVNLHLPDAHTTSGKLAALEKTLEERHKGRVNEAAHALMRERLSGRVKCKDIRWRKPYRTDHAVVELHQLCMSVGQNKTFWVTFDLENRSEAELYIEGATLEAESQANKLADPTTLDFDKDVLGYGETARGMALATLTNESPVPSSWKLVVTPASSGRRAIEVSHLTF